MKTTKKQTQCQRLLAYLKRNRKGITTMEAFEHLRITCVHKRIAELEGNTPDFPDAVVNMLQKQGHQGFVNITRTKERTASGSIVTRYKLAR
jgi:hypothetical protein